GRRRRRGRGSRRGAARSALARAVFDPLQQGPMVGRAGRKVGAAAVAVTRGLAQQHAGLGLADADQPLGVLVIGVELTGDHEAGLAGRLAAAVTARAARVEQLADPTGVGDRLGLAGLAVAAALGRARPRLARVLAGLLGLVARRIVG